MSALILSPMVPRERLAEAEARSADAAALWAAIGQATTTALDEGISAACWALAAVQRAEGQTLRGRIVSVAITACPPDDVAALLDELHGLDDVATLTRAVAALARAAL